MRPVTIMQLQYFCAVCRYGSISKAAEALYVSHPTISVAIKSLEKEFSLELYAHTGNRVILTEEGKAFYRKAVEILERCDDMYATFAGRPEDSYPVHVGIPPIRSTVIFPDLLREFHDRYPIPVVLHEYSSRRSMEKLENHELDCCMVNFGADSLARFHYRVLLQDRFVFCVSKENPLSQKEQVTAKDLDGVPLILQSDDSVLNEPLLQAFYKVNARPNPILYSSQLETILNFIREGSSGAFLYGTIADSLRKISAGQGEEVLAVLPFRPVIKEEFVLFWQKGGYMNRNVKTWISFVKNYFSKYKEPALN